MGDGRIIFVFTYGQSNAHAGGLRRVPISQRLATREQGAPSRTLMLNTGLLGVDGEQLNPESITDIVPASENESRGESGGSSFMRYATTIEDQSGRSENVYAYRTFGRSGTILGKLRKGGKFYSDIPTTLRLAQDLAERQGYALHIPGFIFRQGEADASKHTRPRRYRKMLKALADDLTAEITEITRQSTKPWMLLCVLSASSHASRYNSDIIQAQIETINTGGSRIVPSICPYWMNGDYGFITGQAAHWKPLAKAFIAEYEARAFRILLEALESNSEVQLGMPIRRLIFDGTAWKCAVVPFETAPRTKTSSIRRENNVITGDVYFSEGGLHIFSEFRPPARNHGFAWSGTENIVSVSTQNSGQRSSWRVELEGWNGRGGVLSYAATMSLGTASADSPSCHGDIFDYCKEVSIATGLPLRSGMLPFWQEII